jgi:predicted TIM-barrel fold metal-dependent hydrolase
MPLSAANLHFRPQAPVFDAQICVGHGRSALSPAADRAALLAELDRHGVDRALIYHVHSEDFSPPHGNQLLEEWLGGDGRLLPLWAALPTDESLTQLQALCQAGRARAVRLISAQGLPFCEWTHGTLLEWLSEAGLPLWIALPEIDARDLVATLRGYPQLRVVLAGAHYSHTLLVQKIMAALPNVSLELSRYESLDAINDLIARFGTARLLYGSWYPRYAIGAVLYFIHHCGLPAAALKQICSGNLERLLGLPQSDDDVPSHLTATPPTIAKRKPTAPLSFTLQLPLPNWKQEVAQAPFGRDESEENTRAAGPIIDFHGHVGHWDEFGMADDPARMLAAMDAAGIDQSVVFNIFHADSRTANDATAAFVARNHRRFIGFAYVTPLLSPEAIRAELTRCIDQLGFRAIKLYPPYRPWPLHDEHWFPIYEFAQERGLTVLLHTGTEAQALPRYLSEIAPRFPRANFVAGHSGNVAGQRQEAIEAARAHPNIYLETCSSFRTPGVIEELVERGGADRVLFGSDTPLMDPRCQIGKIITAAISDETKRLILGENALRLLQMTR